MSWIKTDRCGRGWGASHKLTSAHSCRSGRSCARSPNRHAALGHFSSRPFYPFWSALSTVGTFRIWLALLRGLIFDFKERVPAIVGSSVAGDSAYRPRVCRVTAPPPVPRT